MCIKDAQLNVTKLPLKYLVPTPINTETLLLLEIIKIAMSVPRYLQPLVIFDTRVSTRSNKTTYFREKEQLFLVSLKVSEGTLFLLLPSSTCGPDSRGKVVMLLKSVDSHD